MRDCGVDFLNLRDWSLNTSRLWGLRMIYPKIITTTNK